MRIERGAEGRERLLGLRLRLYDDGFAYLDSAWSMRDVCSPYTRLYFVYGGEGAIRTPAGERALAAGRMYLIPSELKFDYWCPVRLEKLYFHVMLEQPDGFDMLGGFTDALELAMPDELARGLRAAYGGAGAGAALHVKGYIYEAIAMFTDAFGAALMPVARYSPLTQAAFRVIRHELGSGLTLKAIAQALDINPSTLGKRFRAETGLSMSDYIDSLLMLRLQRRLLTGNSTLMEIADELGFCDQFYMSRYFKKRQGETPSAYRRRLGGAL